MTEFTLGAQELGETQQSNFAEFINIVTGRSVISGADWGKDRIELGLSGDGMVRIFWAPDGLHANFISTTNKNEIPPLMLQIVDGEKRVPARILEKRLRALRTLYAIVHLSLTDRFNMVQDVLLKDPNYDLELLLNDDELTTLNLTNLFVLGRMPGLLLLNSEARLKKQFLEIINCCIQGMKPPCCPLTSMPTC